MALVIGAVIGSIAGTAYGLLNAPQPGWRTRADLSSAIEEQGDRLASRIANVVAEIQAFTGTTPVPPIEPDPAWSREYQFAAPPPSEETVIESVTTPSPAVHSEGVITP
jgi:gas vesicle protein